MIISRDILQACVNNAIREIATSKFVELPGGSARAKFRPRLSSRLGTPRRRYPRRRPPRRTTITNASRRACTRAYTRASERVHTLRSSAFPPRGRRSSVIELTREIQNKRSRRGAAATCDRDWPPRAATASEDRCSRGRITAHALYLRCIPKPPTANHPRTHVVL